MGGSLSVLWDGRDGCKMARHTSGGTGRPQVWAHLKADPPVGASHKRGFALKLHSAAGHKSCGKSAAMGDRVWSKS
jgi:hypothetical protein